MPITGLRWGVESGYDLHILRNGVASLPLNDKVFVVEEDQVVIVSDTIDRVRFISAAVMTNEFNADNNSHPDFRGVFFIPTWSGRAAQANGAWELNGININILTGVITARPVAGARINNFILTAQLNINGVADPIIIRITVHVHESIAKVWTTPALLTARPDTVKGVSKFTMELISTKPVTGIVWHTDSTHAERISKYLANDNDPFTIARINNTPVHIFSAERIFNNRKYFPAGDIFYDPIFIGILYADPSGEVTQAVIPVHRPDLMTVGAVFRDSAGDELFRVTEVTRKPLYQLSVHALFNDDIIGDITADHGLTWAAGAGVGADRIRIEEQTGLFEVFQPAAGNTLTVTVNIPPSLRPARQNAAGRIAVRTSWRNEQHQVTRLPGSPANLSVDDAPNVLFVAEGFDNTPGFREQDFTRIVMDLHAQLSKVSNPKMLPWNHLFTKSINAWTLYIPSEERGGTILYESIFGNAPTISGNTENVAVSVSEILSEGRRLNSGGGLTLDDLVNICGLPIPADAAPAVTLAVKIAEWRQFISADIGTNTPLPNNPPPNPPRTHQISNDVFACWKRLVNKRVVEERNSYWGLACGEKPKKDGLIASNKIRLNPHRANRNALDLLFAGVQDAADNSAIGEKCWGRNERGEYGKDYGLVVFLVGGLLKIGTRFSAPVFQLDLKDEGIGVGLADDVADMRFIAPAFDFALTYFRWRSSILADKDIWETDPFAVPARASIPVTGLVAHELAHSFNLSDEYAVKGRLNVANANGVIPAPLVKLVSKTFNLQLESTLTANGPLDARIIKWRWPRVQKAAVCTTAPVVNGFGPGTVITATIRENPDDPFKKDDQVNLRRKEVLDTIGVELSPVFTVVENNRTTGTLTLRQVSPELDEVEGFGAGSLIVIPVTAAPGPDNPFNEPYFEVMSPLIRAPIGTLNLPNTPHPCVEDPQPRSPQNPRNIPNALTRPSNRSEIIGLYAGGLEFSCGIYHPSGMCIMRKEYTEDRKETQSFCHVCRYALVDQIDPIQHHVIEKDYRGRYPTTAGGGGLSNGTIALIVVGVIALAGVTIVYGDDIYNKLKEEL